MEDSKGYELAPGQIVGFRRGSRTSLGRVSKVRDDGYVDWEEFGTMHARSARPSELTVRRRTYERGPKSGRFTSYGDAERRHDLLVDANRPVMHARVRWR